MRSLSHVGRPSRRAAWTLADQAVSSIINLGVSVFVARAVPADAFGGFSLAFATYLILLGVSRACTSSPLGIRFSTARHRHWQNAVAASSAASLVLGVAAGLTLGLFALFAWGPRHSVGAAMLALAFALPLLLLQDQWRFAFFARAWPQYALVTDLVWATAIAAGFGLLTLLGVTRVWTAILAWGAAAGIAAFVSCIRAGVSPNPPRALSWFRAHRDLTPSLLGDYALSVGITQAMVFAVAALSGLAAAGALRGAQVIFGPVNVVIMAASATAVPEGSRLLARAPHRLLSAMGAVSVLVASVALTWGCLVTLLMPDALGHQLLGDTWLHAGSVLPALTVLMAASGVATGALVALRVLELPSRAVRVRALGAPFLLMGGTIGALLHGAPGAVWGQCIPMGLMATLWWTEVVSVLPSRRPTHVAATPQHARRTPRDT